MNKTNVPIANEKLLENWDRYCLRPTEENTAAFLDELAGARFLVPISRINNEGEKEMKGKAIRFFILVTQDRENFLPVFTDMQELEKWTFEPFEKVEAAVASYRDIIRIITDDPQRITGLSINPFSQNLALNRSDLAWTESMQTAGDRGRGPDVRFLVKGDGRETVYRKKVVTVTGRKKPCSVTHR